MASDFDSDPPRTWAFPEPNLLGTFPQVLDSDPYQRDDRTDHESLPVTSGVKFGVHCADRTGTCPDRPSPDASRSHGA